MDLTPVIPAGRQVIERYGAAGFRVAGVVWRGSVIIFPELTISWPVRSSAELSAASFDPVVEHGGVQILLLGLGRHLQPIPSELRPTLRRSGIAVQVMDTGAACRTFNVLLAEDRLVAAALIPPI